MKIVARPKPTSFTFGKEGNKGKFEGIFDVKQYETLDEIKEIAGSETRLVDWLNLAFSNRAIGAAVQYALGLDQYGPKDVEKVKALVAERTVSYDPFSRRREGFKTRAERLAERLRAKVESGEGASASELDEYLAAARLEATEEDEADENGDE